MTEFRAFLASHHTDETDATAALKIAWLGSMLREDPPLLYKQFRAYGQALQAIGPNNAEERNRQAEIVSAFTSELRNSNLLAPPRAPRPAMPRSVFTRAVEAIASIPKKGFGYKRARLRTAMKLTWSIGLKQLELRKLRWEWIEKCDDGYALHYRDGTYRNRDLAILSNPDQLVCPVAELRSWFERLRQPTAGYVFPFSNWEEENFFEEPTLMDVWSSGLRWALTKIGLRNRYCWESIRRSFQNRCRERLGYVATSCLCGYLVPNSLALNLRREQDWPTLESFLS